MKHFPWGSAGAITAVVPTHSEVWKLPALSDPLLLSIKWQRKIDTTWTSCLENLCLTSYCAIELQWTFSAEIIFIHPHNVLHASCPFKLKYTPVTVTLQLISATSRLMNTDINISVVCACFGMWHISLNDTGWADLPHNHTASALLSPSICEKWDMTQSRKAIQVRTHTRQLKHTLTKWHKPLL